MFLFFREGGGVFFLSRGVEEVECVQRQRRPQHRSGSLRHGRQRLDPVAR